MPFENIYVIFLIIALVITAIGFKKTVWFISIGYTWTILAFCISLTFFFNKGLSFYNYLQILFLAIWSARLGYYLFQRGKNIYYKSSVEEQTGASQDLPVVSKFFIWISVAILYLCMFSPAIIAAGTPNISFDFHYIFIIGLAIMAAGVGIEGIADYQKSKFKKQHPKKYCSTGLYSWVRYPNYFGEIMVWLGNYICAIPFYSTWWQWAMTTFGLICIVLIMIGSAKRLEQKQSSTYGENADFQKYEQTVPILIPWIPLYTLKNAKIYLG